MSPLKLVKKQKKTFLYKYEFKNFDDTPAVTITFPQTFTQIRSCKFKNLYFIKRYHLLLPTFTELSSKLINLYLYKTLSFAFCLLSHDCHQTLSIYN